MLYEEKQIETIPVGPLGLIPLKSCEDLGKKVDAWLVEWRKERESEHKTTIAFAGYQKDSYIIGAKTPRFGSGEAKGELTESSCPSNCGSARRAGTASPETIPCRPQRSTFRGCGSICSVGHNPVERQRT